MGVDESEVGYKAGLIEALFTFAQFCTSEPSLYAIPVSTINQFRVSSTMGETVGSYRSQTCSGVYPRNHYNVFALTLMYLQLIGLAGCSISVFAFGLSQTFVTMVITRAL